MEGMRWLPVLAAAWLCAQAAPLKFHTVPDETVLARLQRNVDGNSDRAQLLHTMFQEAGCAGPHLAVEAAKGSKIPNIVCTLPGDSAEELVLVTAHHDKVHAGAGAIDNWSGASLLPSLYESLAKAERRKYTYLFIGFADEEAGLVGSKAWVNANKKTRVSQIRAMVNIDSVGSGQLYLWHTRADKELAQAALRISQAIKFPLSGMSVDKVGMSDSFPFAERKVPVIDFHSLNDNTILLLHTIDDQLSKIDKAEQAGTYRFLTIYLYFLDDSLGPRK